jgi:transcriptional regulator with XRE-family HTH domain
MDDETRAIAARIAATARELQRAKGMSDADLARRSGLEPAELETLLGGETEIPLPALYLIAGALGVKPSRLLG